MVAEIWSRIIFGFIILVPLCSLFYLLISENQRKKRIVYYEKRFEIILPTIGSYPNPHFSLYFYDLGEFFQKVDDVHINLAGACLKNFDIVLRQKIDEEKISPEFHRNFRDNILTLLSSIKNDDKYMLIHSIYKFYLLLYKDIYRDVDLYISRRLKNFLYKFINFKMEENFYETFRMIDTSFQKENDYWNFDTLSKVNLELIFIYNCFQRFLIQFYIDYPDITTIKNVSKNKRKFKYLQQNIKKSLNYAENHDKIRIYWTLSEIYRINIKSEDPLIAFSKKIEKERAHQLGLLPSLQLNSSILYQKLNSAISNFSKSITS